MVKLTEKNLEIHPTTYEAEKSFCLILNFRGVHSEEETKQLKQQILDDYEKARKYPNLIGENQNLKYERIDLMNKSRKDQKLRELIEKKIEFLLHEEDLTNYSVDGIRSHECLIAELQKLLEGSKK